MSKPWPTVKLGDVVIEQKQRIGKFDADNLPLLGVSNQVGLHRSEKPRINDMSRYLRVKKDWFAYNPMRINVGSIGWAQADVQTGVISPDYVVFSCSERILPRLLFSFLKHRRGLQEINKATAGSVRERLYFEKLAQIQFALPPVTEQRRIVARIEELADQIHEVHKLRTEGATQIRQMLMGAFGSVVKSAPRVAMREIAPLVRRPTNIGAFESYAELGIRSFGKGTFHKPALSGLDLGSKRIFRIEKGDLLFSNVFAWEGAIAVAKPEDNGRYGSHRFMSCVPKPNVATAPFLHFYFLTNEGIELIRAASPGGAGRNRTLGIESLANIEVPVPSIEKQQWFDALQAEVDTLKRLQAETAAELDALLPAILDKAFKGEL